MSSHGVGLNRFCGRARLQPTHESQHEIRALALRLHFKGEPMKSTRHLSANRALATLLAMFLLSALIFAQARETGSVPEMNASQSAMAGDKLDINTRHQGSAQTTSRHRRRLFAEDHRRPPLPREDRSGSQKDYSAGHLRQDQGSDHRQAAQSRQDGAQPPK